jgi:hypothetical protein
LGLSKPRRPRVRDAVDATHNLPHVPKRGVERVVRDHPVLVPDRGEQVLARVRPVSQLSQLSQDTAPQSGVADVASFAAFATFQPRPKQEEPTKPVSSYGESLGGRLLTWTGRVVSLDAWRKLSEWEKHGP